ncbi:MAG: tRNA (guanosine(37)-N1)-methyltransferase TrmD [Lachnospiraceae bacterium]|nr:tRNA (guanosine(37)-N1)-methyltransferase TrmD [Lachnospiraceae bacterium]
MNFHILTLFPEMVMNGLDTSIIGRAMEKGSIRINAVNIRDYTANKHKKVDDYPYGGGAGMLMQAQPVYDAYLHVVEGMGAIQEKQAASRLQATTGTETHREKKTSTDMLSDKIDSVENGKPRVIYVTPQGTTFNQNMAKEFAKEEDLIFLCGHYEGIDERVLEEIVTDYVSIGDYVLTGGELPAMVMIDTISRLVPGVLNNEESAETESFSGDLLEYPQYSRPEEWNGKKVPEVVLSGHHANIEKWRLEQSILRTRERRPDLYHKYMEKQKAMEAEKKLQKQKKRLERLQKDCDCDTMLL